MRVLRANKFYVVNYSGNRPRVSRRAYDSKISANIYRNRKERDTGETWRIDTGQMVSDIAPNFFDVIKEITLNPRRKKLLAAKKSRHYHSIVKGYDGHGYTIGDRVEIHPGTDLWMRGARFGTVVGMSATENDRVKVELDKIPGRKFSGPANRFKLAVLTKYFGADKNPIDPFTKKHVKLKSIKQKAGGTVSTETLYFIRGTGNRDDGKKISGMWTGRGTLTDQIPEAAHYHDKKAANKTRDHLQQEIKWLTWNVQPINFTEIRK